MFPSSLPNGLGPDRIYAIRQDRSEKQTMKLCRRNLRSGGALIAALIICIVIGIMLVAYLSMVTYQHKFSQRSQVWNNSIAMCEVGMEEALAHLNHANTTTNFAINGWNKIGTNYYR